MSYWLTWITVLQSIGRFAYTRDCKTMTRIKLSSLKSHKAFTLVEVVVVLAVISVLVGVGAVTSTKYQQDARDSQRSSRQTLLLLLLKSITAKRTNTPAVRYWQLHQLPSRQPLKAWQTWTFCAPHKPQKVRIRFSVRPMRQVPLIPSSIPVQARPHALNGN